MIVRHRLPGFALMSLVSALVAGVVLAACSYSGPPGDPVSRRLSYFSFLAADDIREACEQGGPERYRFVYNAEYSRQVRLYDVVVDPSSGAGRQTTRVLGGRRIGPFQFGFENWLLEQASYRAALGAADLDALRDALAAARFAEPPPARVELWSDDYYWLVSGCVGGRFHQNGYARPSARYEVLRFAEALLAHDGSGIALAVPPPGEARASARRFRPRTAQQASEGGVFVYLIEP